MVELLWKTVWHFLKKLSIELHDNFTLRYILKRTENICSHKNLYMNVHGSIIYISQKGDLRETLQRTWCTFTNSSMRITVSCMGRWEGEGVG